MSDKEDMKTCLSTYYSVAKEMFIIFNREGFIFEVNGYFENYFGLKSGALKSKSIYSFLTISQVNSVKEKLKSIDSINSFDVQINFKSTYEMVSCSIVFDNKKEIYICKVTPKEIGEYEYKELFDQISMGVLVYNKDHGIIKSNKTAFDLLELSENQLLGRLSIDSRWKVIKEDYSNFEPSEHPVIVALNTGIAQNNKTVGIETHEHQVKWFNVSARPIFKDNKSIASEAIISFVDITEMKKAELENKQFFNSIEKTFLTTELNDIGIILNVNDEFCKISGYRKDELVGHHYSEFKINLSDENVRYEMCKSFQMGKSWIGESRNLNKDGDEYWLNGVICPIINERGQTKKFITIRSDVTDQKKLSEKVNSLYSWQKALLDGTSFAFIAVDTNGTIVTFNSAAEKMLGYTAEEVIGKETPALFHLSSEIERMAIELSKNYEKKIEPNFNVFTYKALNFGPDLNEWHYRKKDGTVFSIRLCVTAIFDNDNNCIGYLGISEDLTEQKNMKQLLDTQRAQMIATAKLSSLGELSAGIAHEINNPLAVIVGKSSQLKRYLQSENVDLNKIQYEINKIEQMGQRISKTIKGMKLFSRNGENDNFEVKSLNQIFDETYQICIEKYRDNSIEVVCDIDSSIFIKCRPTQISQIFLNLLNNSFDAINELPIRRIHVSATVEPDNRIKILFTDSGEGVPLAIVDKIMEPFYTTKLNGKGTGIGLSISKRIAEEHSGELYLDRNAKNTTFVLILPSAKVIDNRQVA